MNQREAIQAMKDGKKITHKSFQSSWWYKSNQDGTIVFNETGREMNAEEFWADAPEYFRDNWDIVETKP